MSTDAELPDVGVNDSTTDSGSTTDAMDASGIYFNKSVTAPNESEVLFNINETILNTTNTEDILENEYLLFEKFAIIEIVMTTIELIISVWAVIKMPRWRKNYRNQMLLQLTLGRFLKRVIFVFKFLQQYDKISSPVYVTYMLSCGQFYVDLVIVILVFFFIKHMYDSLIIVLVKVSQNNFYKVLICSWLIPLPIIAAVTLFIMFDLMDLWFASLLICSIFRWPLIFIGTGLYITIVYRVLTEKIRHFASSLAVVTFLLCLIINVHLFSKDIIELWYPKCFSRELIAYVTGFLMNLLILVLYVILIALNFNNNLQASKSDLPDFSLVEAKL